MSYLCIVKQKIIITGGMGYIGSHTAVELIESGFAVVIIDNLSNAREEVLDGIHSITGVRPVFEKLDLVEHEKTLAVFEKHKDAIGVIHFAALKAVGESVAKPGLYFKNNILSLVHVLECMERFQIPNLIFSSSCTVYGEPDKLPVTEETPTKKANSPYGATKQIGEEVIQAELHANSQLKAISLRYFNPVGAHNSAKIGELPLGVPNNLMPYITQTALGIREELSVFGADYNTKDGTAIRDYIHVVDLAKAHVSALDRLAHDTQEKNYEIYNIGTGKGYTVLEVIHAFERATGQSIQYKMVTRRAGDVEAVYANANLANEKLAWSAQESLETMCSSAYTWEKMYRGTEKSAT